MVWKANMEGRPGEEKCGCHHINYSVPLSFRKDLTNESSSLTGSLRAGFPLSHGSMEESQFHPGSPSWEWELLSWQKAPSLFTKGREWTVPAAKERKTE